MCIRDNPDFGGRRLTAIRLDDVASDPEFGRLIAGAGRLHLESVELNALGRNRDDSAIRHGIAGVHHQVDDHLLDLAVVSNDQTKTVPATRIRTLAFIRTY